MEMQNTSINQLHKVNKQIGALNAKLVLMEQIVQSFTVLILQPIHVSLS